MNKKSFKTVHGVRTGTIKGVLGDEKSLKIPHQSWWVGHSKGVHIACCNSQQNNARSSQAHQAPSYKRGFRGVVSMGLSASFYLHCPYQARPTVLPLKLLPTLPGSEVLPFPLLSYSWLQKHKLWHLACLVWILVLPLTCCVTLDDLLNFSEPLHL